MGKVFIEQRELSANMAVTWDMALHLYARNPDGMVLVVSESPTVVMSALRKQWLKLIRRLENAMAGTLNAERRKEMQRRIGQMESMDFRVAKQGTAGSNLTILFVRLEDVDDFENWKTTYVLMPGRQEELIKKISRLMDNHGLIVDYGRSVTDD